MTEQMVLEYLLNAVWQLPLLVGGAVVLLRVLRMEAAAQHGVWMGVLAMALVLPLHGVSGVSRVVPAKVPQVSTEMRGRVECDGRSGAPAVDSGRSAGTGGGGQAVGGGEMPAVGERVGQMLSAEPAVESQHGGRLRAMLLAGAGRLLLVREIPVSARVLRLLAGGYALLVLLALGRVGWAWDLSRRLLRESSAAEMGEMEDREVLARESARLRIAVPAVRRVEGDWAETVVPMAAVVGIWRPVLLLGPGFAEATPEERRAVLCHELAHVRRDDGMAQTVTELLAVPMAWHPAVAHGRWGLKARLRQTREMACDAEAAEAMQSRVTYARCLLRVAWRVSGVEGMGAVMGMADGVMEERVLRLVEDGAKEGRGMRTMRAMGAAAVCAVTVVVAGGWHLRPVMAEATARVVRGACPQGPECVRAVVLRRAVAERPAVVLRAAVEQTEAPVVEQSAVPDKAAVAPVAPVEPGGSERGTAWVSSPEFQQQMRAMAEEARKQGEAARAMMNSPELRRQMREAARVNTPEFREQISRSVQQSLKGAQLQLGAATATINSDAMRKEMARAAHEMDQAQVEMRRELAQQRSEADRDAAQDKAEAARDAAQEKAEAAREAAEDKAEAARDAAEAERDRQQEAREAAEDKAEAARDAAEAERERKQEAAEDRARAARDAAQDKARVAREAAQDKARAAQQAAEDKARAQQTTH